MSVVKTWIHPITELTTSTAHFEELTGTMPQLMKLIRLSNPWRLKIHMGMIKSP